MPSCIAHHTDNSALHIAKSYRAMVLPTLACTATHLIHAFSILHKQKEKDSLARPLTWHDA